jgi:hypothetical protein
LSAQLMRWYGMCSSESELNFRFGYLRVPLPSTRVARFEQKCLA